ncbi:unnamed protein product [Arabis nemorensis]|uniref:Uncharacterized protein n=1 Tax=Arabis nemorensis TaxID=586526 RepID=A0A565BKC4_9BRAS|nr:unnamed protein product [Arabis nemorensis]
MGSTSVGPQITKPTCCLDLGIKDHLEAYEVISPLIEILVEVQAEKHSGPRGGPKNMPKGPGRLEQRISKALGVNKKIKQSPFLGSRYHKHASLLREDPAPGCTALNGVSRPLSSTTSPGDGQRSRKLTGS